jgi:AcrR family transcriptional regulator
VDGPRSKRPEILAAAVEHFGRDGYEYSKLVDIASDVGIGSTALYHYFESKLHCLYEIQFEALKAEREQFDRLTSEGGGFGPTIRRVLEAMFDGSDHEVLRNRVLVGEAGLLAVQRDSPREEDARRRARAQARELEFAWATFLTRGMEQEAIPQADPRLLTFALLGLASSVWRWYRPAGALTLDDVREFFVVRCLVLIGAAAVD